MSQADDPIAALAVDLNAESKAKRSRKAKETPPEPVKFTLDEHRSDTIRAAREAADPGPALELAWTRFGSELGFDPETVILQTVPDFGEIDFAAIPIAVDPVAAAAQALADSGKPAPIEGFDDEGVTTVAMQNMISSADDLDLASETLVGDLSAAIVEVMRRMPKPFDQCSQQQKRDLVEAVNLVAEKLAKQSVDLVAAQDRVTVKALVDSIAITDKVIVKLKLAALPEDEMGDAINSLHHCLKKSVMIVTADHTGHMGKRREIVEPDEEELPFDAGSDAPGDDDAEEEGGDE